MKAARFGQFGGPEVLEIVDLPDPHPGAGQVRVAVHAAGINPTDWKQRQGLMGGELPQTTGREVASVVDELGDGRGGCRRRRSIVRLLLRRRGRGRAGAALLLRADPAIAWLRRGRWAARSHRDGHAQPGRVGTALTGRTLY